MLRSGVEQLDSSNAKAAIKRVMGLKYIVPLRLRTVAKPTTRSG
jgi:hypothetical protein